MTAADLMALCDAALDDAARTTPGPWHWSTSNSYRRLSSPQGDGDVLYGHRDPRDNVVDIVGNEANKAFIANVRTREPEIAYALSELLKVLTACFEKNQLSADIFIAILKRNQQLQGKLLEACDLAEKLLGDPDDPRIAALRQEANQR